MKFTNKQYDRLKWAGTILLPSLGAFYAGLAVLWGLPKGTEVSGSLGLLATLSGVLLGRSSKKYAEKAVGSDMGEGE